VKVFTAERDVSLTFDYPADPGAPIKFKRAPIFLVSFEPGIVNLAVPSKVAEDYQASGFL
jgi:hypothetical protein